MALSATTTLPHSVDNVAAVLVNEDFQRHVSQLVGGSLESFTVDGDVAGAFSATSVRTLPTTRLRHSGQNNIPAEDRAQAKGNSTIMSLHLFARPAAPFPSVTW